MNTFYASLVLDGGTAALDIDKDVMNVAVEAQDMLTATRIINAYLVGRFAASGKGGEISHIGRAKVRGVTYGAL